MSDIYDSDDSSDIENLFRKARENKRRKLKLKQQQNKRRSSAASSSSSSLEDDDNDDDEVDDDGDNVAKSGGAKKDSEVDHDDTGMGSRESRRNGNGKLAAFEQQRAISHRKRILDQQMRRKKKENREQRRDDDDFSDSSYSSSGNDGDEDDDEKDCKLVMDTTVECQQEEATGSTVGKKAVISLDDLSSSEDDDDDDDKQGNDEKNKKVAAVARNPLEKSSGDGGSAVSSQLAATIAELAKAAASLQRAQQYHGEDGNGNNSDEEDVAKERGGASSVAVIDLTVDDTPVLPASVPVLSLESPPSMQANTHIWRARQQLQDRAVDLQRQGVAPHEIVIALQGMMPGLLLHPAAAAAQSLATMEATQAAITVVAELVPPRSHTIAGPTTTKTVKLAINTLEKVGAMAERLLDKLGVPRGEAVVTLKNAETGQTLYAKQSADHYGLLKAGCTLHAKVHLMSLMGGGAASAADAAAKASSDTAHKKSLGRSLKILVRRPSGETVAVKTYQKQSLRAVLEEFLSQLPPPLIAKSKASWKLKFDGDVVDLDRDTPQGLGMDDDDLVDAVER
jgi:hypothetical protein